jgi:hypothetical protein
MSTVFFQSPSLPTISHLPVTVTGAFALLEVGAPLFEFVFGAGVLDAAGLFAAVFDELTETLPEQAIIVAPRIRPRNMDAIFFNVYLQLRADRYSSPRVLVAESPESNNRRVTVTNPRIKLPEYARVPRACQLLFRQNARVRTWSVSDVIKQFVN